MENRLKLLYDNFSRLYIYSGKIILGRGIEPQEAYFAFTSEQELNYYISGYIRFRLMKRVTWITEVRDGYVTSSGGVSLRNQIVVFSDSALDLVCSSENAFSAYFVSDGYSRFLVDSLHSADVLIAGGVLTRDYFIDRVKYATNGFLVGNLFSHKYQRFIKNYTVFP